MLRLTISESEYYDEDTEEFVRIKPCTISLEHSLISMAKWESKWKKPFLSSKDKSYSELLDYIKCMTINNVDDENVYLAITPEQFEEVSEYINDPMTATTFNNRGFNTQNHAKDVITAEILYYGMVALQIPFECQKWHLNRLMTLLRVCEIKNQPPKKIPKHELYKRNAALNAARRAKYNTSG